MVVPSGLHETPRNAATRLRQAAEAASVAADHVEIAVERLILIGDGKRDLGSVRAPDRLGRRLERHKVDLVVQVWPDQEEPVVAADQDGRVFPLDPGQALGDLRVSGVFGQQCGVGPLRGKPIPVVHRGVGAGHQGVHPVRMGLGRGAR